MCSVMQTNIANYYCVGHSGTGKLKATLSRLSVCSSVSLVFTNVDAFCSELTIF